MLEANLDKSWRKKLDHEFKKEYMLNLMVFLERELTNKIIFPPVKKIFNAFNLTKFNDVKVVILGQDPYHGFGQANGLSFSVENKIKQPPSLINIFKELESDIGKVYPNSGSLTSWASQGVLLLNATLTVEAGRAGSHQNKGWEQFTDAVIDVISTQCDHIVFLLWGNYAKQKGKRIDRDKHLVLSSGHPSPLSANRGLWFGNRHFSQANTYLISKGRTLIHW